LFHKYSSTVQDVELNRQLKRQRRTHGNDTNTKKKELQKRESSGDRPPGRPENEKPFRINLDGLIVDDEGVVIGPVVEGTYLMPARTAT
jgi:hypothetical protein